MKAILEFNLNDADDIRSHERCVKAEDMALILWEIQYNQRRGLEKCQDNGLDPIEAFYDWFNEEMIDRGINLDKLIV